MGALFSGAHERWDRITRTNLWYFGRDYLRNDHLDSYLDGFPMISEAMLFELGWIEKEVKSSYRESRSGHVSLGVKAIKQLPPHSPCCSVADDSIPNRL